MPKISVIVAVYNIEQYLERCIQSVLKQTYTDFELILVNDGSKDSSLDICLNYEKQDDRIIVLDKENGGLSDARNKGLEIATGEYIEFIDGDDFVEENLLELCVNQLDQTKADIVMFDVYQYYTETNTKEIIANPFDENKIYNLENNHELLTNIMNCAWNKLYRRSLFIENAIQYPKGYYYEDLGTTYRLVARANKIAFVNTPLYNYLQDRPGNITSSFNRKTFDVIDMIQMNVEDFKQLGIYDTYYEELKFLGGINILECLKKTRSTLDYKVADELIDVCFDYINKTWPEFPKCKYQILREKYDWVYANKTRLKMYLWYKRKSLNRERV